MSGFDALHPAIQHHIVNTLDWASLRPLQEAAIDPLLRGEDALLLAPTAGGKTEAAIFPVLSRMASEDWRGTSVLYLCPLKALLNNLEPRVAGYASRLGRDAVVRHGDTGPGERRRQVVERPDVLLTTPESLESILVSATLDAHVVLADVRAVIVDELHAFAGDDRGWHLLAVLERLTRITGRPLQRIGLSATIGNPEDLLRWLQGGGAGLRPGRVVAPERVAELAPEVRPDRVSVAPDERSQDVAVVPEEGPQRVVVSGVGSPGVAVLPEGRPRGASRRATSARGHGSVTAAPTAEVGLDFVGSTANAARVIAALHRGQKRLVFADSRRRVEQLAVQLAELGVAAFVSHSSLSAGERRRAETAFAEARDCVIVSTSTLELGIDVGDLDRVLQVGAPGTVASLLQRLGRTGRRPGTTRNLQLLAVDDADLLRGAGLGLLWGEGYVEPIVPPASPAHLAAQQLLALALQEGRIGRNIWPEWLSGLPLAAPEQLAIITDWLVETGHLDVDSGMLFIGPEAERAYGRRHFMELMTVVTADPQVTVLHGRDEIGAVDPIVLVTKVLGPRIIALAGRSWRVTAVDWARHRAFVEPAAGTGLARWMGSGAPRTYALTDAIRRVLLGAEPVAVQQSRRAASRLADLRADWAARVDPDRTVVLRDADGLRWWTFAGGRGNAVLHAALDAVAPTLLDPLTNFDNDQIPLRFDARVGDLGEALATALDRFGDTLASVQMPVGRRALEGLKFSDLLPPDLAAATLAGRLADGPAAQAVARRPIVERTAAP